MRIVKVPSFGYESNCWIIIDEQSGEYAMIDPSTSPESIDRKISELELDKSKFKYALLTHGHFDHIYSVDYVREKYNCQLCIHKNDAEFLTDSILNANKIFFGEELIFAPAEKTLCDGDVLMLGETEIQVIHTPGHTAGSVCYKVENSMLCGDTIFDRSIGRTDLPSGDQKTICESLRKIKAMNGDIRLYPGHGSTTTIKEQIQSNPYLKGL